MAEIGRERNVMDLSIVIPVLNEQGNVVPLLDEVLAALRPVGIAFEVIFVDDGSTDQTAALLTARMADTPELRLVRHDGRYGQSMGVRSGVLAARGRWVGTLDGDRQNDPADLPSLWALATGPQAPGLIAGERIKRNDNWQKRYASRFANWLRQKLLNDGVKDTGCGVKMFRRDLFLEFPHFDHMHRYLPALARRHGAKVLTAPVHHRARQEGRSKYGTLDRALVGVTDLFGVWWLIRRSHFPIRLRDDGGSR